MEFPANLQSLWFCLFYSSFIQFFFHFVYRALKYDVDIVFHLYSHCSAFFGIHENFNIHKRILFLSFSFAFRLNICIALHSAVYFMIHVFFFFYFCKLACYVFLGWCAIFHCSKVFGLQCLDFIFLFVYAFSLIISHAYELFLCYACWNIHSRKFVCCHCFKHFTFCRFRLVFNLFSAHL